MELHPGKAAVNILGNQTYISKKNLKLCLDMAEKNAKEVLKTILNNSLSICQNFSFLAKYQRLNELAGKTFPQKIDKYFPLQTFF